QMMHGISKDVGGLHYGPMPADYDRDGKADFIVYNGYAGQWYGLLSGSNYAPALNVNWGGSAYTPLKVDLDGDGKADLGLYEIGTGNWYALLSKSGYATSLSRNLGGTGYFPTALYFYPRGVAPRTPPHRRSLGAAPPRSAPVARSRRSLAPPSAVARSALRRLAPLRWLACGARSPPTRRRSPGAAPPRSAPVARSRRSLAPHARSSRRGTRGTVVRTGRACTSVTRPGSTMVPFVPSPRRGF